MEEDEPDDVWHQQILSDIKSEVSCDNRDLCEENLRDSREQVLDEKR